MENGFQKYPISSWRTHTFDDLFETFSKDRCFDAFWSPFGSLYHFRAIWLPFGSFWLQDPRAGVTNSKFRNSGFQTPPCTISTWFWGRSPPPLPQTHPTTSRLILFQRWEHWKRVISLEVDGSIVIICLQILYYIIFKHVSIHYDSIRVFIYIYIERERERER